MDTMSDNQSCSSPQSAMDINTPSGSLNNDDVSNASFSDAQLQTLNDCDNFAYEVLQITSDVRHQGYSEVALPKFPRSELLELLGLLKTQHVLRGNELHNYLRSKVAGVSPMEEMPKLSGHCNLDDMLPDLITGYRCLMRKNVKILQASLDYGKLLNEAFDLYELKRLGGETKQSWRTWLKNNIGISDSYARQLREMNSKFGEYKGLRHLTISFSELWRRRSQIEHMLRTDNEIASYWS
jgi:hypothetical protein